MTDRLARSPLVQLTLARLRLFFREPSTIFWSFAFPILLTVALGIAFRSRPPEPVFAAVEDGPGAARLVAALRAAPDVRVATLSAEEARAALRVGRVAIVVVPGDPPTYRYDPTRPESRLARATVDDLLQRDAGRVDAIGPREERVAEPGSRYVDFLIPGLVGMNVMSTGMWGIGYTIVEMRQKKLLKRLVATPMRRGHFLLSFVLVRMLFLAIEVPLLFVFGVLVFELPVRGPIAVLGLVSALGALAFAGLGLLVASRARNTQTVGGLINLVMLPMFVLSGVFFSSANFPEKLQPLIRALPLTALNDALRAVMNEG
ncbi:MAG TPA: ABC transporter permease, partial [Anaeromyxobacteraceae bacterium]|nr:ABC transporter permease [Anaeromyxobacteraceae bacterium]